MLQSGALLVVLAATFDLAVTHPKTIELTNLVRVERGLNEPVRVVSVAFASPPTGRKTPDVIVDLVNRSDKPVWFVQLMLGPPDTCPRWEHPFSSYASYGRIFGKAGRADMPAIQPGGHALVVVSGAVLQGNFDHARRAGCRRDMRTEMVVSKVAFSVTQGWEAVVAADGETWTGRAWEPSPDADPP